MSRFLRSTGILAAGGTLVMAVGCGSPRPAPPPGLDVSQRAGWQIYVDLNCAACHGENREGRRSGPPLVGLAERWKVDQLVSYLMDPDAMVASNPRLAYTAEKYALGMPKVSGKSPGYASKSLPQELRLLSEYLLVDIESPE